MSEEKILSVLHVDDSEDDRFLFARSVKKLPISLSAASSGDEALKRLAETKQLPDMILLDIRMPRMSGFEVLEKLKSAEPLSLIPVVMFSNSSHPGDVQRARQLGAMGYCVKPADAADYQKLSSDIYSGWVRSRPPCLWPDADAPPG